VNFSDLISIHGAGGQPAADKSAAQVIGNPLARVKTRDLGGIDKKEPAAQVSRCVAAGFIRWRNMRRTMPQNCFCKLLKTLFTEY
jgi:hypothetical protein